MPRPKANAIDKHVGARVRMRRMMLGISQTKLGDACGVTFQQIQKNEQGTNRLGSSRLQQLSQILKVPVAFFFEGAPAGDIGGGKVSKIGAQRLGNAEDQSLVSDFFTLPGAAEFARAFVAIDDNKRRRMLVDVATEFVALDHSADQARKRA
jgi:transcriptional regulator with XRE-family HTH domain